MCSCGPELTEKSAMAFGGDFADGAVSVSSSAQRDVGWIDSAGVACEGVLAGGFVPVTGFVELVGYEEVPVNPQRSEPLLLEFDSRISR